MNAEYSIPASAKIGHIHLKVADLERSLNFYCDLLGFKCLSKIGDDAAFISAGDYHHHIGLNTWYSKNSEPPSNRSTGLFHFALLYPTRKDLAQIYKRLLDHEYPLTGVADHGVSEAIYLSDPDHNGLELYTDRPRELWPKDNNGNVKMFTQPLDIRNLLSELDD
ncbi:MAG: VOC family protein [Ginsengibacter sp.]|jgi:catechol 2,3-dioxygenase